MQSNMSTDFHAQRQSIQILLLCKDTYLVDRLMFIKGIGICLNLIACILGEIVFKLMLY